MENKLPEASFVAFTAIVKDGWEWHTTVRKGMTKTDIAGMFDLIEETQKEAIRRGYEFKPQQRGGGFPKKEVKIVGKCPTCNADLIEGRTKAGKVFWKCSTQKYDPINKVTSGCSYVNWDPQTT